MQGLSCCLKVDFLKGGKINAEKEERFLEKPESDFQFDVQG